MDIADKNGVILVIKGRIIIAYQIIPGPVINHLAVYGDIGVLSHGTFQIKLGSHLILSGSSLSQDDDRKRVLIDHPHFLFHKPGTGSERVEAAGIHDGNLRVRKETDAVFARICGKGVLLQTKNVTSLIQK